MGYQGEGTRGRTILEGAETVSIFGIDVPIRANILELPGLSAHADMHDLHTWLDGIEESPKRTFIVHGEVLPAQSLQNHLEKRGWSNVIIPDFLENFVLFEGI